MPERLRLSRRGLAGLVGLALAAAALAVGLSVVGQGRSSTVGDPEPSVTASTSASATPSGPSLEAYRGLGSWVDIYDDRAWNDPAAAVRDMSRHGVRTLFIETGNSHAATAIHEPAAMQTFIREAHALDMRVVAWYLPDLTSEALDSTRVAQAIGFRTSDGQGFDSFALDIESSAVRSTTARNSRLATLSGKIRDLVGPSYPLGAIIPSPVGISTKRGYWDTFPYAMLARTYDVFLPMSYYTYHGSGEASAYSDTVSNVRILRAQRGCSKTPIHLIGGIAEDSSPAEVRAFVRAERETQCLGASLYGWAGTTGGHWQLLKDVIP